MARAHHGLARAYTALGRLILDVPTDELFSSAKSELFAIREDISSVLPEAATEIQALCESMSHPLVDIRADYAGLFSGVKKLPAPPWESCYLSGKRQVCTEITESVRLAYLEACLCQDSSDTQPDDHIGLELQFLGAMSKHIADLLGAGDFTLAGVTSAQRNDFVTQHLSKWGTAFCSDLEKAAATEFYRVLARVVAALIRYELDENV